jgi:hypothetical protein
MSLVWKKPKKPLKKELFSKKNSINAFKVKENNRKIYFSMVFLVQVKVF